MGAQLNVSWIFHEEEEKKNRDLLPFPDFSESGDRHEGT